MVTTKRPAIGQVASLGTLYDARTDSFLPNSLFSAQIPDTSISRTDNHRITFDYSESDSFAEMFTKMGFGAELKASFLAGLVNAEDTGSHFNESRDTNRIIQSSMYHKITTVHESLQLIGDNIRSHLAIRDIEGNFGTHVVSEITWGACTVVTAKHQRSAHDTTTEASTRSTLKAKLQWLQHDVTGQQGNEKDNGQSPDCNFDVHVYSDVVTDFDALHTTFMDTHKLITQIPQYISESDGGKGRPVMYTLFPLLILKYMHPMEIAVNIPVHVPLNSDIVEKFVQLFDNFRDALLVLSNYQFRLKRHRNCVPAEHINEIDFLKCRAIARRTALKSQLSTTLEAARSGTTESAKLCKLLDEFSNGNLSPASITATSGEYADKIDFVDLVTGKGAKYVSSIGGIQHLKNGSGEIYVFHFNRNSQRRQPAFDENSAVLLELLGDNGTDQRAQIIVKDYDLTGENLENPYISHESDGTVTTEDVVEERRELADKCIMRYITEFLQHSPQSRPTTMAAVRIPCPSSTCSLGTDHAWICYTCRASIFFSYSDTFLYCDCGRCSYKYWRFHCKDPMHGAESWPKYQDEELLPRLTALEPLDALNILILGETGVGKSTFINAFVNYLTYDTLDDAMKAKRLDCIIPFSFATQAVDKSDPSGRFVQTTVSSGTSNNESDGSKGQSATQRIVVHSVQIGSYTVRLIDTPGIGDIRGASQDTKNMADILSVIANYEKIHGIVILLKPNNSRLTLMFRFCIKELLTHLHRDAARIMVFGFTNTRGSNYKPGDTFAPLKNELEKNTDFNIGLFEHTVYCFDSESFRYLAAYHQRVDLGDQADYNRSWEKSAKESQRLLTYFLSLKPHLVKSTVTLNETRHMITELTKLMSEIIGTMNATIRVNEEQIKSLSNYGLAIDEKKAFLTAIKAEHDEIDRAAIRFCIFLKKNSITPYNDATLDYLAFMIREERGNVAVGGDSTKLEDLERYRDQYEEKVKILATRMLNGDDSVLLSEQEVYAEVKKLCSLKHYGQQLSQIKSIVNSADSDTLREESPRIRVKAKRWTASHDTLGSGWRYVRSGSK